MSETVPTSVLVVAARDGDKAAWDALVERFAGVVVSVARQYRLHPDDVADVSQTVWLRLVENLGGLRDPRALAGWIVATTRHECIRVIRASRRQVPFDPSSWPDVPDMTDDAPVDQRLLDLERHEALREAFAQLPERCRHLFAVLAEDPRVPYTEIGDRLKMPRGSIGPTRSRCLEKLRQCPALLSFLGDQSPMSTDGGEGHAVAVVVG